MQLNLRRRQARASHATHLHFPSKTRVVLDAMIELIEQHTLLRLGLFAR
jgi:hypothetical protein